MPDANLLTLLATARRRVRVLEMRLAETQGELAQRERQIQAQGDEIAAVLASRSWRLTRPVRALTEFARGQLSVGQFLRRLRRDEVAVTTPEPAIDVPPPIGPAGFPLAGALAALPELAAAPLAPLALAASVVIPTLNAGAEFHWLLRKLNAQRGLAGVQVVVVDSGSSDGTPEVAEAMGCTVVRIVPEDFSHSHARNVGADAATGDLLLFTVQDAYPIGDHWLRTLADALRADPELAAVSCAEFPRTDSELIYNAAIRAHYQFLGCSEGDRVGRLSGQDHHALRTQGQLSDVACMIPAVTFQAYRYEGSYAEDLLLGIKLIRDGRKVAMLSSVRVIHSHNRPAAYYLKRAFVDLVFLTDIFPDFAIPPVASAAGAVAAASDLRRLLDGWRPAPGGTAQALVADLAAQVRTLDVGEAAAAAFGLPALDAWIAADKAAVDRDDARHLRDMFAERLDGLAAFAAETYGEADATLVAAFVQAIDKTLAATLGAQLGFFYLSQTDKAGPVQRVRLDDLRALMLAGI